ncbi:hypothetical protein [Psychrobacter sp. 72-O-c]|uniref:hypothetical protein n=1 Tax=Psychrobacter sp. 72-O-c TaxID=2774125 RepID=UPI0019198AD5|nr:hypothetical protein [Psychrobacter sp. 72-O-c]
MSNSETVTLDKTGEHTIRVLQPRNQARESNEPKPYYSTSLVNNSNNKQKKTAI